MIIRVKCIYEILLDLLIILVHQESLEKIGDMYATGGRSCCSNRSLASFKTSHDTGVLQLGYALKMEVAGVDRFMLLLFSRLLELLVNSCCEQV